MGLSLKSAKWQAGTADVHVNITQHGGLTFSRGEAGAGGC